MSKKSWNTSRIIWKVTFLLGLLILAFGVAWPVLADYLGPDRDYTYFVWERSTCTYLATKPGGSCSLTLYYPPHDCVAASLTAGFFNNAPTACGAAWGGTCGVDFTCSISLTGDSVGGCSEGQTGCTSTEHTGTQPPATISGNINCDQTGNNGWCVGTSSLALSANEPVGGYSILLIEGTRNGETFACPGSSCNVPLTEGQNDFTYWALSSWGDSSLMGASSGKVDSQPPQVSLTGASSFCPDCGESLSVTLIVSDVTSGVSSWTLSLDGTTLNSGSAPASQTISVPSAGLSAGSHILSLSASDIAGNVNSTNLTFTLLLPTPTPTFTPIPTSTPVGGSPPGNPPAGQSTSQSSSSSQVILATPTSITSTPSPTPATQTTNSLPAVPAAPSGQDDDLASDESVPGGQQQAAPMPPELADAVFWGSMAAGAVGFTMAYVLDMEKKRKEEEARARLEAERANAEARAIEKGYDSYQDMVEAEAKAAFDANWNAMLAATQASSVIQPDQSDARHLKARETPTPPPRSGKNTASGLILKPTSTPIYPATPTQTANAVEPPLTTEHSNYPRTLPYAGSEVKQFCEKLESEKSGWWYSLGDFTFEDCNGLFLLHENAGRPLVNYDLNLLTLESLEALGKKPSDYLLPYGSLNASVAAQQLYIGGWSPPYCPSGSFCVNGAFNFWAAYSQSVHGLIDQYVRGNKPIEEYFGYGDWGLGRNPNHSPLNVMIDARALGNAMLYPKSLNPDRWNAMSQCGSNLDDVVRFLMSLPSDDSRFADLQPGVYYPNGYGDTGLYYFTSDGSIWSSTEFWRVHLADMGYKGP